MGIRQAWEMMLEVSSIYWIAQMSKEYKGGSYQLTFTDFPVPETSNHGVIA